MRKGFIFLLFQLLFLIIIFGCLKFLNNRELMVGVYMLNLSKTDLGRYSKDSVIYKNLSLELYKDGSFKFNMDVPFIYDSSGIWIKGNKNPEDWNYLKYQKNKLISTQFDYEGDELYLNSTTPKKGNQFIQEIYFRRSKRLN